MAEAQSTPEIDDLYSGALEDFTTARDALAKKLRDEGDAEEARRVKKLRKPTAAAWLVNQLAHRERSAVRRFLASADELRSAQERAQRGRGAEGFRTAQRAQREALEDLISRARRIGDGSSAATFDRVRETLEAALTDPGARSALEAGRLERELRPGTIAVAPGDPAQEVESEGAAKAKERAAADRRLEKLRAGLERAEAEQKRLEKERSEAEEELHRVRDGLREAKKAVTKLRREVDAAQRRRDRL